MKQIFCLSIAFAALALVGCSGPEEVKETPGLRQALTQPPKFDINNVPPQYRDRVRAMTGGGKSAQSAPAAAAPGSRNGSR